MSKSIACIYLLTIFSFTAISQDNLEFCDGQPGKFHANGGGFVADTAYVDSRTFLGPNVKVCDNAQIENIGILDGDILINKNVSIKADRQRRKKQHKQFKIIGKVIITDEVQLKGFVEIHGEGRASIRGKSKISEEAKLSGEFEIYGSPTIAGKSRISDKAKIYGDVHVIGNSVIKNEAEVYGSSRLFGGTIQDKAKVHGYASIYHSAIVAGEAQVSGMSIIMDETIVKDFAEIKGQVFVRGKSVIFGRAVVEPPSKYHYLQLYNDIIGE